MTYADARRKAVASLEAAEASLVRGANAGTFSGMHAFAAIAAQHTELAKVYLRAAGEVS